MPKFWKSSPSKEETGNVRAVLMVLEMKSRKAAHDRLSFLKTIVDNYSIIRYFAYMKKYTQGDVFNSLRERLSSARGGTQQEVARKLGFSPQFLSDVLNGRREITERLADALGFRQITYYVRKRPEDDKAA